MTGDEILRDLNERIDHRAEVLGRLMDAPNEQGLRSRRDGKRAGLLLVKEWLRAYEVDAACEEIAKRDRA
jgi:hypothetical protein